MLPPAPVSMYTLPWTRRTWTTPLPASADCLLCGSASLDGKPRYTSEASTKHCVACFNILAELRHHAWYHACRWSRTPVEFLDEGLGDLCLGFSFSVQLPEPVDDLHHLPVELC